MDARERRSRSPRLDFDESSSPVPPEIVPGLSTQPPAGEKRLSQFPSLPSRDAVAEEVLELLSRNRSSAQELQEQYLALKQKHARSQAQCQTLQKQLVALAQQKTENDMRMQGEIDKLTRDLKDKVDYLEKEQANASKRYEKFKKEMKQEIFAEYGVLVEEMSSDLEQTKAALDGLSAERATLLAEREELSRKLTDLSQSYDKRLKDLKLENEEQRENLLKRLQEITAQNQLLQKENLPQDWKEKVRLLSEELELAKQQERKTKVELERKIRELETESQLQTRKAEEAENNCDRLREEKKQLDIRLQTQQNDLQKSRKDISRLNEEKTKIEFEMERRLQKKDREQEELVERMESEKNKLNRLLKEKTEQTEELVNANKKLEESSGGNNPLLMSSTFVQDASGPKLEWNTRRLEELEARNRELEATKTSLESRLMESVREKHEREMAEKEKVRNLELQLRETEWERNRHEKHINALRKKLEKTRRMEGEVLRLQTALEQKSLQFQAASQRLQELLASEGASRDDQFQSELNKVKEDFIQEKEQLYKEKQDLRVESNKIRTLHEDLKKAKERRPKAESDEVSLLRQQVGLLTDKMKEDRKRQTRFAEILKIGQERFLGKPEKLSSERKRPANRRKKPSLSEEEETSGSLAPNLIPRSELYEEAAGFVSD